MAEEENQDTVYGVGDNGESEKKLVTLKRSVEVQGFLYKPNQRHIVSQEIIDAMGDAVDNVRPAT